MLTRLSFTLVVIGGWIALPCPNDAFAQDPFYRPARPTISPYLNLMRENFGPLPNYHSLVRPQLRQQVINRQLENGTRENSMSIRVLQAPQQQQPTPQRQQELQQELQLQRQGARMRPTGAPPTGNVARFRDTMNYYPRRRSERPRR